MSDLAFRRAAPILALAIAWSGAAQAELGGATASVQTDRTRMGARMTSRALGNYTRHELTRTNGGQVHELANAQGKVFAVTWSGPGKPDLRSLLGPYFATLQASDGAFGRSMHSLRRPPQVARPDLRIQTAGHMGWFRGVAMIPSLAPAGFDPATLAIQP